MTTNTSKKITAHRAGSRLPARCAFWAAPRGLRPVPADAFNDLRSPFQTLPGSLGIFGAAAMQPYDVILDEMVTATVDPYSTCDGSVVTCKEVTSGAAMETMLEDNLIKVFVACEGVSVESESAIDGLTDGPDVAFNGITYSKKELAPDPAFLGVYGI